MPVVTPDSPPKRMTRARAKAVEETKAAPARSTKATTATTSKAVAARNAKRKTRPDDDELDSQDGIQARSKTTVARSRPQESKTATHGRSATLRKDAGQNSSVTSRLATASSAAKSVPGRRTGTATKSTGKPEESKTDQPPARATRARTGSVSNNNPPSNQGVTKKKVTFQDEDDEKENVPAKPAKQASKPASSTKPSGIKAKPLRNGPDKSTIGKSATNRLGVNKLEPLSPRKNVQVTQSGTNENKPSHEESPKSVTPEKELNKSPIRPTTPMANRTPIASPTKSQTAACRSTEQDNEDELDHSIDELQGSTALFTSPTKANVHNSTMLSPPKRPAVSPYKGSLTGSPKKFESGGLRMPADDSDPATVESILSKPPKKFPMTEPRKNTVLNPSTGSELSTSLWSSPAKRPLSPSKLGKAPATTSTMKVMTPSLLQQSPRKGLFSPMKNITSTLRAMKSPESCAKVYTMTPEEQAKMFEDELAATASPCALFKGLPAETEDRPGDEVMEASVSHRRVSDATVNHTSCPASPEDRSFAEQPALSHFDPTLCPSPSSEGNSVLEAVPSTGKCDQSTNTTDEGIMLEEMESDDELQLADQTTYFPSPMKATETQPQENDPSTPSAYDAKISSAPNAVSMTVLAERFGEWKGATPDQIVVEKRRIELSMFTPLHPIVDGIEGDIPATPATTTCTEADETDMDESIAILEDEDELMMDSPTPCGLRSETLKQSQISDASQDYGDENAMPIDPTLLVQPEPITATCTPARVFEAHPKVIHTVCKVPLKPAAGDEDSLRIKPVRRTASLTGELSAISAFELEGLRQVNPPNKEPLTNNSAESTQPRVSKFSEMLSDVEYPQRTPRPNHCATTSDKTETWSTAAATPARTPRPGLNTKLLSGAVVFVDVHTSEGGDASGIFVELLQQMGAKCVKQWNWNSRNSLGGKENAAGDLAAFGSTRVGITHVVFKDGGKRTMEKVREAKGLVLCVGVGWVLDCERENKWLDEADYAIDSSTIPRGGHRRRKSMEPKALANTTFAPPQMSPTKEFLDLSSPVNRRATTIGLPKASERFEANLETTQEIDSPMTSTPKAKTASMDDELMETPLSMMHYDDNTTFSPTTPYFMHPEQLVQQTCPPKQSHQLLFPLSGRIEDEPDERLRQRLILARRKSLQWAPKVASPLSRAHSYQ